MDTHGPSHTARGAALLRAAHLVVDDPPPIFLDPLALPLCGFHDTDTLHTHLTALQAEAAHVLGATHAAEVLRAVRAAVLVRSRYTEEAVEAAVADGVRQYVILGAGLESF